MRRVFAGMKASLTLAVAVALALAAAAGGAAPKRSIAIVGVSESGGVVTVDVRVAGWKMYPRLVGKAKRADGGHWHVFVDGRYDGFSTSAKRGRTTKLAPGRHAIHVELANNDHTPLKPPVRSRAVSVVVLATGDPAPDPGEDDPKVDY